MNRKKKLLFICSGFNMIGLQRQCFFMEQAEYFWGRRYHLGKKAFFIVDVFAEQKYAGNQLAVFPEGGSFTDEEMQLIARETNFSETTFIPVSYTHLFAEFAHGALVEGKHGIVYHQVIFSLDGNRMSSLLGDRLRRNYLFTHQISPPVIWNSGSRRTRESGPRRTGPPLSLIHIF